MSLKKFLSNAIFIICLLSAVSNPLPATAFMSMGFIVSVSPKQSSARVNETFSINVSIANVPAPGLWAYEFKIYYNASLLEPISAKIPPNHFLKPTSPDNLLIIDPGTINQTEGTVSFAATLISPEAGKTGGGTLTSITFVVKAPGNCTIEIKGYVSDKPTFVDGNGEIIPSCGYSIVNGFFEGLPPQPPRIPPPTPKPGWETLAFSLMGVYGYLTYPSECHPNDTITHELVLAAQPGGIHVNRFAINISCETLSEEKVIYTEEVIQNEDLPENWFLNKSISLRIPSNAHGKLRCSIIANTYKRFATCNGNLKLYTTQVRALTYDELLTAYNQLLNQYNITIGNLNYWIAQYQKLNSTYKQLLDQYNYTLQELNRWIAEYKNLNATYNQLLENYNSLNISYHKLEKEYASLETSYNSLNSSYHILKRDYDLLQTEHNDLVNAFNSLNSTYTKLLLNYTALESNIEFLQNKLSELKRTYDNLASDYKLLNSTYHSLLSDYNSLRLRNSTLTQEIQNAKILWGIFLATTLTAIASTIYLALRISEKRKGKSKQL